MVTISQYRIRLRLPGYSEQTFCRKKISSLVEKVPTDQAVTVERRQKAGDPWRPCGAIIGGRYHDGEPHGLAVRYREYWQTLGRPGSEVAGLSQLAAGQSVFVPVSKVGLNTLLDSLQRDGVILLDRRLPDKGSYYVASVFGEGVLALIKEHFYGSETT